MEDGDAFQEAFYDELLCQSSERASHDARSAVFDMAKAMQMAVLRMSLDEGGTRKATYRWAAFVFQGLLEQNSPFSRFGMKIMIIFLLRKRIKTGHDVFRRAASPNTGNFSCVKTMLCW